MVDKNVLSAFLCGALFGFGLCISRMVDPAVVVGFLDVTGRWDPSLLFVMAGALAVALVAFPLVTKNCKTPVCEANYSLPTNRTIDSKLIIGSVIFGLGWGLGGVCPGPAVSALAFGIKEAFIFFAALYAGMVLFSRTNRS
jgi:uncharacterized membrane protein YedE/YeeE